MDKASQDEKTTKTGQNEKTTKAGPDVKTTKTGQDVKTTKTSPDVKKPTQSLKKCTGKDNLQRMNYLYQIANALVSESETENLAATMYSNLMVAISKKAVQRMDIGLKRTICKGCRTVLLAGVSCKVRLKKKRITWTCLQCRTNKVFDVRDKNYEPWTQREESLVELLNYN